ncbi:hypothetical protein ACIBJF_48255 [Streptomyces sp. NPDC050743]|uniref:hypothetical protein n=1 Tax=Streptomyces sp. NPDC050743 TaxID=3365634 RepID=UPI0037929E53
MPAIPALLVRKLGASLMKRRRATRSWASRLLLGMSRVRSCPYCHAWIAPQALVCPRGHGALASPAQPPE